VSVLQPARPVEVRQDEERARLSELSAATLEYMLDHGLASHEWLRRHRIDLGYLAEEEHDLLEAMRLSERLNSVDRNSARTARRNERLRAELIGRGAVANRDPGLARSCRGIGFGGEATPAAPHVPVNSGFTGDVSHARSGLDED